MRVALLRGINVGGKNKLPMSDLAALFVESGCENVQTFIQSGNVIFDAGAPLAARLPTLISAHILKKFGYRIPVVLRTARELEAVVANNPFGCVDEQEDMLYVMFLADVPGAGCVEGLNPLRSAPDEFVVRGREIYLRLPNGAGRSKLTNAWFDARLKTVSTARNWRTTAKLLEMASG
jgi:uncharacterized protein (DUF1697 family)